mgnify:CR=1 FL=1
MSHFSGTKLRQLRVAERMSLTDVFRATGISRAQISRIENSKADPRMSTVVRLLSCYDAGLSDLESRPPAVLEIDQVLEGAVEGARRLESVGLVGSDPAARLDRKEQLRINVEAERLALDTRRGT